MTTPGGGLEKLSEPDHWWSADAKSETESVLSPQGHAMRRSRALQQLSFVFGQPTAKRCQEASGVAGGAARK
jgi:hypothetical protein